MGGACTGALGDYALRKSLETKKSPDVPEAAKDLTQFEYDNLRRNWVDPDRREWRPRSFEHRNRSNQGQRFQQVRS